MVSTHCFSALVHGAPPRVDLWTVKVRVQPGFGTTWEDPQQAGVPLHALHGQVMPTRMMVIMCLWRAPPPPNPLLGLCTDTWIETGRSPGSRGRRSGDWRSTWLCSNSDWRGTLPSFMSVCGFVLWGVRMQTLQRLHTAPPKQKKHPSHDMLMSSGLSLERSNIDQQVGGDWRCGGAQTFTSKMVLHSGLYLILLLSFFSLHSFRYLSYGSGPKRFPLADVLQYAMEFASSKPVCTSPVEDIDTSAPPGGATGQQLAPPRQVHIDAF